MSRVAVQDLVPATNYAVQVRAVRDGQYSEWSEQFLFTTTQNTTVPAAPATVTWVVVNDGFYATWTEVTQDISGNPAIIDSYELEMVAGATTKYVIVPAQYGQNGQYTLDFQGNVALFGSPQPSITLRVRAVNHKGIKGNFSGAINASNPVPANVTGFAAVGGMNIVDLTWNANTDTDLDRYEIYTGTTAGFTPSAANRIFSGNVTHFVYTTTTYSLQYFKIRAYDKFNQPSAADASASATPTSPFTSDVTAPSTPTALAATITNNANGLGAKAAVTWTMSSPPSDLAGFNIRYRAVATTNYQYMSGIDSAARAAQVILDLAYTNYEFQIQAFDFSNNFSAWSATVTATSPANAVPANVSGLTSTSSSNAITYSWTAVADTDIKNYEVTFSTSSTFASGNITYLTGTATTLTVGGLAAGTTYYARVRAVDQGGLTSAAWSATNTKATTATPLSDGSAPASSPTPTVASGIGYLFASWTAVANNDPVTYEVHISTTTGFTPSGATKVAETASTVISLEKDAAGTALTYGTTYYVKLIAKD
ncbi:MAG TPA: fibronectin type III domain-containing protein, partial [Dongiaceae bacterium]|nr:fibronectin type III domain-containing protein [Dongiaceae bacterium]